tara:strand:- start:171 stop:368 length:198 start_codon:yes stop_codon:yes gene_type:complete
MSNGHESGLSGLNNNNNVSTNSHEIELRDVNSYLNIQEIGSLGKLIRYPKTRKLHNMKIVKKRSD